MSVCCWGFAVAQSVPVAGALPSITLESLEGDVPKAPGMLAEQSYIVAALDEVAEAKAKAGLDFTYENSIGPAAIIVPRETDEHVFHYEQSAGISVPILGAKFVQDVAIIDAQERAAVAKITYDEQLRHRIAGLRDSYSQYWQYDAQAQIASAYATTEQVALKQAEGLRKAGFWTNYNLFDFFVMLQKVKSEETELEASRQAQLARIASAVGYELQPFTSVEPAFFKACMPSRDRAVTSAYDVDATLAILKAQVAQVNAELARVRGSSVDARIQTDAGSQTDINYQVSGYDLKTGVAVILPGHARAEEQARKAAFTAQLEGLRFDQQQRRVELASEVDAQMADISSAQTALAQATAEQEARQGDVEKAIVRYDTIRQPAAEAFDDVQQNRDNLYAAQRAVLEASGAVLSAANRLLEIAPQACP
ncbi:MAG TPA: TolC family protein [Candidatus Aquilonibacter sp.]